MDLVSEKPLKPIWHHAGHWWAIGQESGDWRVYRHDDVSGWVSSSPVLDSGVTTMDVHLVGNKVTWYGWHATAAKAGRVEYAEGTNDWSVDIASTATPNPTSTGMKGAGGHMTVDSLGRTWCFVDSTSAIRYFVLDTDLTTLVGDTLLTSEMASSEHLSRCVAWDGKVGVFWDDQSTQHMRFKYRNDGDAATTWQAAEEASEDLVNNADDHGDITPGPAGELLAIWKTNLSGSSDPIIRYSRRTAGGAWVDETTVWNRFGGSSGDEYTRPRIMYDAANDSVVAVAIRTFRPGPIRMRISPRINPDFDSPDIEILADSYNDPTVAHHRVTAASDAAVVAPLDSTGVYVFAAQAVAGGGNIGRLTDANEAFPILVATTGGGFPAVESTNGGVENSATSSHVISLPTGIVSGDLLLGCIQFRSDNGQPTLPAGWTSINNASRSSSDRYVIFARLADGSEGASITLTTPSTVRSASVISRISGHNVTDVSTDIPTSLDADTSSDTASPELVAPWGSANTLWIALFGGSRGQENPTPPAGFTDKVVFTGDSSNTSWATAAQAYKEDTQTTQVPTTWTDSGATVRAVGMAAVEPAAATEQIVPVGLAIETNAAQALTGAQLATLGLATETNTANAIAPVGESAVSAGLATETDAAQALTGAKTLAVGLASETSAANAVVSSRAVILGQAVETDAAAGVTGAKLAALSLATETNAAQTVVPVGEDVVLVGQAVETATAPAVAGAKLAALGLAEGSEDALGIEIRQTLSIGLATSTEQARAVGALMDRSVVLGLAEEHDAATGLSSGLAPFWSAFYDQTTPGFKPSKRKHRPVVFMDRDDGTTYVIVRVAAASLELREIEPTRNEEVFAPFHEPVMMVGKKSIRVFVETGELLFEEYPHKVRSRPILFGSKERTRTRDKRYILTLPDDAV